MEFLRNFQIKFPQTLFYLFSRCKDKAPICTCKGQALLTSTNRQTSYAQIKAAYRFVLSNLDKFKSSLFLWQQEKQMKIRTHSDSNHFFLFFFLNFLIMEITITQTWTNEELSWHYNELFWGQAKRNLQNFAENHELEEMNDLFDTIIDYATCGETENTIELTKLNNIIWFDWDEILQYGNIN